MITNSLSGRRRLHRPTSAQRGRRTSVVWLLTCVAALCAAGPTGAAEPTIEVRDVDVTAISAPLTQRCGFPVQTHTVGSVRTTTFFDEAGAAERMILTAPGGISTTYTNTLTGATLELLHPFNEHFIREADGSWVGVFAGVRQLVVLPGEGAIRVWAGRWEFESTITRRVLLPYIETAGVDRVEMNICEALMFVGQTT